VLRHLEDVDSVFCGDFLSSGTAQALFLPLRRGGATVEESPDILSMADASMDTTEGEAACCFSRQFLLTDFSQVDIDRWNPTAKVPVHFQGRIYSGGGALGTRSPKLEIIK